MNDAGSQWCILLDAKTTNGRGGSLDDNEAAHGGTYVRARPRANEPWQRLKCIHSFATRMMH